MEQVADGVVARPDHGFARTTVDPWRSAAAGALYRAAMGRGRALLGGFRGIDAALAEDLVSALLLRALPELLAADRPMAFFATALRRDAISWLRRRDASVAEGGVERFEGPWDAEEGRMLRRIDGARRLRAMSPREREVLLGLAEGADREQLARRLGTTRANIDQIAHRARVRTAATAAPTPRRRPDTRSRTGPGRAAALQRSCT